MDTKAEWRGGKVLRVIIILPSDGIKVIDARDNYERILTFVRETRKLERDVREQKCIVYVRICLRGIYIMRHDGIDVES